MRRFVVGLSILAVLTFSSAILRGDDQQIAQHLIQKLKQQKDSGKLRGFGIDLKVERGTVLLKGHVSSAEQQRLVLEIARRIEGVKQVVNDIAITSSVATPPASLAAAPSAKPLEKNSTIEELGKAVRNAFAPQKSTAKSTPKKESAQAGQSNFVIAKISRSSRRTARSNLRPIQPTTETTVPVQDTNQYRSPKIAQQILQELRQHKSSGALKHFGLDMKVDNGVVKMTGHVASAAQQHLVLETVRRVVGVKLVINDIQVQAPAPSIINLPAAPLNNVALGTGVTLSPTPVTAATTTMASAPAATPAPAPIIANTRPIPAPAQRYETVQPYAPAPVVHQQPQYRPQQYQPRVAQMPLAFAPAGGAAQYRGPVAQQGPMPGGQPRMAQMPPYIPVGNATPARYDHPQMPGYAWPSYAPHPNYAGVTYPKQYSPSAWPYIGPFYPYPQVPLGWRKVSLEWKDGWWMLDFKERR